MGNKFIITTDSTADLSKEYYSEHNIRVLHLSYTIDGETYEGEKQLDTHTFYERMRNGALPTTSQINPEQAKAVFSEVLSETDADIIHIAFSSGLSGSCNSARIAAEELAEEGCPHRICVIDSLCASLGEGLLVHNAVKLQQAGCSFEDACAKLEDMKLHIVHNFTVDDLFNLYRGGRVSKTTAVVGTLASIKPILHVDNEGHLIPVGKVRGRKKSLIAMADAFEKQVGSYSGKNDVFFISHGDCEEDARFVADLLKERTGISSFMIEPVGPTIGAHSGPGTIALFYLGDYR